VREGATVAAGDPVMVVSVMKMDTTLAAPAAGHVGTVHAQTGAPVRRGDPLITFQLAHPGTTAPAAPTLGEPAAASKADLLAAHVRRMDAIRRQLEPAWRPTAPADATHADAAGWASAVNELEALQRKLDWAGHEEGIVRQLRAGKMTVRERVAALVDPGSWREFGSVAGKMLLKPSPKGGNEVTGIVPANFVAGRATIGTRPVVVAGDDFTIRGGHADGALARKQLYAEQMARDLRVPMVRLLDGSSGGGSVATYLELQATYVPPLNGVKHLVAMLAEVPVAAALLGPVVGFASARATLSHFSVMVRGQSQLFVAGPPVVHQATGRPTNQHACRTPSVVLSNCLLALLGSVGPGDYTVTKESLGGAHIHGVNGAVDNVADSEAAACREIARFLSYLPSNAWQLPPRQESADPPTRRDESLLTAVARDRRQPFDMRRIIASVVDRDSFFEVFRRHCGIRAPQSANDAARPGIRCHDPDWRGMGPVAGRRVCPAGWACGRCAGQRPQSRRRHHDRAVCAKGVALYAARRPWRVLDF